MGQFDNIDACRQRVEKIINGTSPVPGLSLILTYQQCLEYCGTGYGNYPAWSVVSALTDWVIPLFLLLGNITYSESSSFIFIFKGNNYGGQLNWIAVISHLLVNPFDFLLSLALKLDSGRSIKERVDRLGPALDIESEERKYLCGICYALEDFDYGVHVETLLASLEHKAPKDDTFDLSTFEEDINKSCTQFEANLNWESIRTILRPTARNIAAGRRHNKLHSTLAIIMYGKDVFIALIQGKCDENFPYHLPHTLALRQLYYWLFCAITLSAAAGGFANQWSSHAFLNEFLEARIFNLRNMSKNSSFQYTDIQLDRIEPWSGGNYHWRYRPPGYPFNITLRKTYLLLLVIAAIGSPIVIAFLMSWFTPTAGLGARGIAELSFAGMWVLNCILTRAVSWKWQGKDLFKIYLWNTFWSLASLFILFGAFQGWYNNCASWSGLYSRGPSGAFLDLNMKKTIKQHIFTFYLPMTAISLLIQLSVAAFIIWLNWQVMEFTIWSDDEHRKFVEGSRGVRHVEMTNLPTSQASYSIPLLDGLPPVPSGELRISFDDEGGLGGRRHNKQ